ncbi:RNA ligase family protein [Spongiactinospora sp. TRM90649]|uniref:RNA ligase family protein n=1 Tax=Spongiactinospora sp. TRM90649 TaxID=3031114 RepID=UPI0023F876C9|nr:RNA ligase family protein [Spongiactinospora sp. TRM90649]MDF5756561.1 RNA ligase family protein [Spongiactinospora sp. TRM90649]
MNLHAINSLTKYPSIPTHHRMDPQGKGGLLEEPTIFTGPVIGTEKVDGTNGRIIVLPSGTWLIGSREDLLTASGDIVHNTALGVVDALRPVAESAATMVAGGFSEILVLYLEVYGSRRLPAWKQYGCGEAAYRLFDVASVPAGMLSWEVERIASWRQNGGQEFAAEPVLGDLAARCDLALTPRLFEIDGGDLPSDIEGMRAFMEAYRGTRVATSGEPGLNEGIVLRAPDRSVISKARFQDYDRTLQRREGQR